MCCKCSTSNPVFCHSCNKFELTLWKQPDILTINGTGLSKQWLLDYYIARAVNKLHSWDTPAATLDRQNFETGSLKQVVLLLTEWLAGVAFIDSQVCICILYIFLHASCTEHIYAHEVSHIITEVIDVTKCLRTDP